MTKMINYRLKACIIIVIIMTIVMGLDTQSLPNFVHPKNSAYQIHCGILLVKYLLKNIQRV